MEGYLSIDQNMRRKVQAIADMLGLETRKMSNTDKGEALELLEARISQLNTWLIIHAHNPFRVKVVEDVRDLERQRTALLAELDNQTNQSI